MSGIALATKGIVVDPNITVVNVLQCRIKAVVTDTTDVIGKITKDSDVKATVSLSTKIKAIVSCEV